MVTIGQRVRHIIGDAFGAAIVEQTIEKAIRDAKERAAEPQSTFYDPMSLFMGREWLTKGNQQLSFSDLRSMATNPIIGSIVQTRINQIAAFCTPRNNTYEIGYEIKTEDPDGKRDTALTNAIRDWIYTTGIVGYGEDLLETFARKFMRDSLILDQACAEIVPRWNGLPAYVVAVDSATIRKLAASLDYATPPKSGEPLYAQVLADSITSTYTQEQMIFGVRNPQTDINYAGYGMSELEMLVRVVTTILNTERYNSGQLTQGGTSKGVFVVKGDVDDDQFNVFKRDFREAIRNASQHWRPPVLRVSKDADVDWKTLDRSNRDMEYAQLFDFLVKQACGVYQIDPAEINWQIGASGARVNFESGADKKFAQSHQKGLKPLLTFLSNQMNINVIQRIDPRFRMEFVGLDYDRQTDVDIREKEVKSVKTLNEERAELGLPSLGPAGDIVLNEHFMAARQTGMEPQKIDPKSKERMRTQEPDDRDVDISQELDAVDD